MKYLPYKGKSGPHFHELNGKPACLRCGKAINNAVMLEQCSLDLEYYQPGAIPFGWPSNGCFDFGADCAEALLARSMQPSPGGTGHQTQA